MPSPPSLCATPAATSSYHARCCSSAPTTRSRGCLPPPAAGPRRPRRRASLRRRRGAACAWTTPTSARTRRMACATMGVTAPPRVDNERPHTKGSARMAASRRQQRQGRPGLAPCCGQPLGQSASMWIQFSTQVPPRPRAHTAPTAPTALRMLRRRRRPLATSPRAAARRRPRLGPPPLSPPKSPLTLNLRPISMPYLTPTTAAASPPRPPSPLPTATLTAPPTAPPTGQQHAASLRQAPPPTDIHTARWMITTWGAAGRTILHTACGIKA